MPILDLRPPRIRSLRTHLVVGIGGYFLCLLLVGVGLHFYIRQTLVEQSEGQIRALARHQAQQSLFLALLKQEVGLRDYLATGSEPALGTFEKGLLEEQNAAQNTLDNLGPGDQEAAQDEFALLQRLVEEWHQGVERARKLQRAGSSIKVRGALDGEKRQFDAIRAASEALERKLDERDNARILGQEQALSRAHYLSAAALLVTIIVAVGRARWVLREVSDPLTHLAEEARKGTGFEGQAEGLSVLEVDILSRSLQELDGRVRERERDLKQKHEEAVAAHAFTHLVQRITREDELLRALAQALERLVEPEALRILLRADAGPGLVQVLGTEAPSGEPGAHAALQNADACRALRDGSPVGLPARDFTACMCKLGVPETGSYLCIPLLASGQALGLVNLQARDPQHWTDSRRHLAESCVSAAAAALQALRALNLANERAIRDGLTGIFNRRFLNELLPKLVDQTKRQDGQLSALMLDIDHFKAFNDRFGHEVGDRVLTAFSQVLLENVRGGDVVARYGGEEFAVLLPHTTYDTALRLAERLRLAVESLRPPEPAFPVDCRITCSIGVATLPEFADSGENLLSASDKALYCAKGTGRNRVVGAGDPDPMAAP